VKNSKAQFGAMTKNLLVKTTILNIFKPYSPGKENLSLLQKNRNLIKDIQCYSTIPCPWGELHWNFFFWLIASCSRADLKQEFWLCEISGKQS